MKNVLISVIVPVYNVEKYLEKCINSIKNQTYKNLEIILVDDGSPDNCPALCDSLAKTDDRIKVFHKENGGVSSARNLGLENATGEFVAFVDSDDYLEKTYYADMVNLIDNNTDFVISNFTIASQTAQKNCKDYNTQDISYIINSIDQFLSFSSDGYLDIPWNKLYKKSLITKNFNTSLKLGEDRVFNLEYIKNITGKIMYSNNTGYIYEYNPNSACNQKRSNIFDMLIVSIKELKNFLIEKFGTFDNYYYFKNIESLFYNCIKKTPKKEYKTLKQKLKNSELIADYKKLYKPKTFEDKIKLFLIKHNMLKMYNLLSK